VHYRSAEERRACELDLEFRLTRARLDLLRSQLQPHFLFNTLNAVTTLMHRDVQAAESMLIRLADLLRLSLDLRDRQEVTLRQEMELTGAYLTIQRIRFGQRLKVSTAIDPAALDAQLPTMILQPLVENAVVHGVARRNATGHVAILASCTADKLRIVVRDDGPGLGSNAFREGVGLANTRERLAQLYGDRAALRIHSPDGGGVEAELLVPLQFEQEADR
jgi:LytS/YehU family sensor histidine kinase